MARRLLAPIVFIILIASVIFIVVSLNNDKTPSSRETPTGLLSKYFTQQATPPAKVSLGDKKDKIEIDDAVSKVGGKALVTFWNSECSECQNELKDFAAFSKEHPDFKLVLINFRESPEKATPFLATISKDLTTYYDTDGSAFTAWAGTMPASYYVSNGTILYYFPGKITSDYLKELLAAK